MFNLVILFTPQPGAQGGGIGSNLVMIGLIVVVFFFFMIRPQQQKAKKEKEFKEGLKKGQRIVTIGGLHGVITDDTDSKTFTIEITSGVRVKIERTAVSMDVTKTLETQPA